MKYKKFLFVLFVLFTSFFVSTKINAHQLRFCHYEKDTLILPVTVGVHIDIFSFHPIPKELKQDLEILVYDENTCIKTFDFSVYSSYQILNTNYYYYYEEKNKTYVNYPLRDGIYEEEDLTPPKIISFQNPLTIDVNYYSGLDSLSLLINAYDDIDGSVTPEVIYDDYSDNYHTLGTYSIIYKACDKSNNCDTFAQKIITKDLTPPLIEGQKEFISYISNPLNLNDLVFSLTAKDNIDGDITYKILLESSNYVPNYPGTYFANYLVTDNSNNTSSPFKVSISTLDDIPPSIEGPTNFKSYLSNPISTKDILANLIVSDNVDQNAYKNIYIINDTYTPSINKLGNYKLVVGAYDKYGNESIPYIIDIEIIDDVIPTISGTDKYDSYLSSPLNLLTIKSNLIIHDNYDGNLFHKLETLEDNYSLNKTNLGTYSIIFIVKDSSENYSEPFSVAITIYDDVPPIISGTNYYTTTIKEKLSINFFLFNLEANDNIDGTISDEIILDIDEYSDNYGHPGTYFLSFYVLDSSGNFSNIFKVKVLVEKEESPLAKLNNQIIHVPINSYKSNPDILNILDIDDSLYNRISTIENEYLTHFKDVGNYKIVFCFENKNYTTETLTIFVNTYENKENKEMISAILKDEKKETILDKLVSLFQNIIYSLTTFFKKLFS